MVEFEFLVTTDRRQQFERFLRWPVVPKSGEKFVSEGAGVVIYVTGVSHELTNIGRSRIIVFGHAPGDEDSLQALVSEMGFRALERTAS